MHIVDAPHRPATSEVFKISRHACLRLRQRIPHLWDADDYRLHRILAALCYQGKRLTTESWVVGQYYMAALETNSQRWLVLAMETISDQPRISLVRTVLWGDEFALRRMFA